MLDFNIIFLYLHYSTRLYFVRTTGSKSFAASMILYYYYINAYCIHTRLPLCTVNVHEFSRIQFGFKQFSGRVSSGYNIILVLIFFRTLRFNSISPSSFVGNLFRRDCTRNISRRRFYPRQIIIFTVHIDR